MTECNLKPHTTILVALRPECLHCGLLQNSDLPPDSTRLGHTIYPLPSLHSLVPASCLICNLSVPSWPAEAHALTDLLWASGTKATQFPEEAPPALGGPCPSHSRRPYDFGRTGRWQP